MYLGVDVGSVSVKMVVLDEQKEIVSKTYLKNMGLVDTIQEALSIISKKVKSSEIKSVGCTGSGRVFTEILLGSDIVKTEILSHTVGTLLYYPDVRTIFDIGGEDCKLITLENGQMNNYQMNNLCGAGTGSMIESIARTLDINIKNVGNLALKSRTKLTFPGKCGILCQSAVISRKNKGARKSDILMGVCRALINTYLSLARSIDIHPPYVFQGATAKNKALIFALEEHLNDIVHVHENCEFMGAIGMAILASENDNKGTKFKGFELKNIDIKSVTDICDKCPNNCEITSIIQEDKCVGTIGSKCRRY